MYLFCFKQMDALFFLNERFQRLKSAHLNRRCLFQLSKNARIEAVIISRLFQRNFYT
eukprot:UN00629